MIRNLRSIAVLGGGITGLSAAIAFRREMPHIPVTVIDCAIGQNALTDHVPLTLPAARHFHHQIGIMESELLRTEAATHRIATRYEGFAAGHRAFHHIHGEYGFMSGSISFHHIWARARRAGKAEQFEAYAPAAVLASADQFVHPENDIQSPLSSFDYTLRLKPERYLAVLKEVARQLGVECIPADLADVTRRQDGGIGALLLTGDRQIEADFFLDCAGPDAPLISLLDNEWASDRACIPIDYISLSVQPSNRISPVDHVVAQPGGWHLQSPGNTSIHAWDGSHASPQHDSITLMFQPGRRVQPWQHNVVALGDAAMQSDPLVNANLQIVHEAIIRLLNLLSDGFDSGAAAREYNRLTNLEAIRVRDFAALHYLRGATLGADDVPDTLAHTLDHFTRRGRLPFHECEIFEPEVWIGALIGLGYVPQSTDPIADGVDADQAAQRMIRLNSGLKALPGQLPTYPDYLQHCITQSQRQATALNS